MENTPRNPFEIALWLLSIVLIVGAVLGFFALADAMSNASSSALTNCDSSGNCTSSMLQYMYQFGYLAAPGVVGGGIACAALALAVRAVDFNARRRSGESEPILLSHDVADLVESHEPQRTAANQPMDPRLFMRPRE